MEEHSAQVWIKIFSVWSFVAAGVMLLATIISMFFVLVGAVGSSVPLEGNTPEETADLLAVQQSGIFQLIAVLGGFAVVFFSLLVIVYIIRGVFLWKHRNWARILTIVMAWIMGVLSLIFLPLHLLSLSFGTAFLTLIALGICVLEIIMLQFNPVVKVLFARPAPSK